jgi:rubrerythrin
MDKKIMEQRMRQLLALDQNAYDIYTKLASLAQTQKMKITLLAIAADEKMHVKASNEILKLILE